MVKLVRKLSGKKLEKIEQIEDIKLKVELGKKEIKEVANKFYEWFKDVFGDNFVKILGSARIKSYITEFLEKAHESDLFHLLLELAVFVNTSLITASIAKSVKELFEGGPRIDGVAIIADDLTDFDEYEITNFAEFLRVFNEIGIKRMCFGAFIRWLKNASISFFHY